MGVPASTVCLSAIRVLRGFRAIPDTTVCDAMRAVIYATVTGILAAILTLITIRFVNVDDLFESTLLILLTSALWYRTWRWIRAARQAHTH